MVLKAADVIKEYNDTGALCVNMSNKIVASDTAASFSIFFSWFRYYITAFNSSMSGVTNCNFYFSLS